MTPQDLAALTAIVAVFEKIGTWPLITILTSIVICPWISVFILNRGQERRHAEVTRMYQDNVELVKRHEALQRDSERREDVLIDLLRLNTESQTALAQWLKNRPRCNTLKGGV